ncbi:GspH/FimT family pseudopilin [Marinobacter salinisoli]|uniref:Type II secretion system protein H n=1 Tax=Marinobacter salinisoli TaxID=2769486 RepID=A0ABX7MVC7_9GAMM|nr:GspH/FimT family pseudopilin [Marinobacter salinisoli]QSP96124.1 GspH/FimT family pseudopilin [Marinobacter salinisoli]
MSYMKRTLGFTLVELMITMAIVAIVASITVPSFSSMVANSRLASASNDIVGLLNYARNEAVKTGRIVVVSPADGSDWANGVSVWVDADADTEMDSSEVLRQTTSAPGDVSISSTSNFGFSGAGLLRASAAVTIDVCDSRAGEQGSSIAVTLGGRIRAEEKTCS